MVGFSVWPTSKAKDAFSHSIDEWRRDPELVSSFGPCFRIRPAYTPGARMFHKTVQLGELTIAATAASSPLVHDCLPATDGGNRRFFLLMPNKPRYLDIAAQRFVQQSGECAIADSTVAHTAAYQHPHASLCLTIPAAVLSCYVPEPDRLVGMRFTSDTALWRLVPMLLLTVWTAADDGAAWPHGQRAAHALLRIVACRYARYASSNDERGKVSCAQVKRVIDLELRNPALTVQSLAERIGVTPRYLQLLFAKEQECVSHYIKRQRLLGCLVDLRDRGLDDYSITEIAFSWGFNSAAHFSSSFKKELGLNPRAFRASSASDLQSLEGHGEDGAFIQAAALLRGGSRHAGTGRKQPMQPLLS